MSAGRRAFGRNDMAAAANLLRRSAELLPERDERRLRLLPDLGEALTEIGELAWAEVFITQAIEAAEEIGDARLKAEAGLVLLLQQRYAERLDRWTAMLLEEAQRAIAIFEDAGDHAGLARAWRLIMNAHGVAHRFGEAAAAAEQAAKHAQIAGDRGRRLGRYPATRWPRSTARRLSRRRSRAASSCSRRQRTSASRVSCSACSRRCARCRATSRRPVASHAR